MKEVKKVLLRSWWGDGADSEIVLPLSVWKKILAGMEYEKTAYSYYEGKRVHVTWTFNSQCDDEPGCYSIDGEDGRQCIVQNSLLEISVHEHIPARRVTSASKTTK